ncbi:hypothetical protein LCGC14_2176180 [marine sediment metagenome]|uniref:UDP-N-acetylglucosamine 2-epimerase domain-containing protein n=1 Tax=marine sediment metagenome TaxID=412755 RepID=A0A0F9G1B0_9ZZZZ
MRENGKRKVCVFIGNRANYSTFISIMKYIQASEKLELILLTGASLLLDKYGEAVKLIENDGFRVDERIYMLIEGENPETMAKSTGLGLIELASILNKYKPSFTLIVADRYEMLAVAIASSYNNIPVVHIQGGEVSGSIDESVRHAITKLSHLHFPSNEIAKKRILQMGEDENYVFNFGCPRIDAVKEILNEKFDFEAINNYIRNFGVGNIFGINGSFLMVSQHPVTTEYGKAMDQIKLTLQAVNELSKEYNYPVIFLWPNPDAGSAHIAKSIRIFREYEEAKNFHFFKNLPFTYYIWLMKTTLCLIGNSSSGIREGSFIGTPVVNIGTRQQDRARGKNVIDVDYDYIEIKNAIKEQIDHGKYEPEYIYGDGNASKRINSLRGRKGPGETIKRW